MYTSTGLFIVRVNLEIELLVGDIDGLILGIIKQKYEKKGLQDRYIVSITKIVNKVLILFDDEVRPYADVQFEAESIMLVPDDLQHCTIVRSESQWIGKNQYGIYVIAINPLLQGIKLNDIVPIRIMHSIYTSDTIMNMAEILIHHRLFTTLYKIVDRIDVPIRPASCSQSKLDYNTQSYTGSSPKSPTQPDMTLFQSLPKLTDAGRKYFNLLRNISIKNLQLKGYKPTKLSLSHDTMLVTDIESDTNTVLCYTSEISGSSVVIMTLPDVLHAIYSDLLRLIHLVNDYQLTGNIERYYNSLIISK